EVFTAPAVTSASPVRPESPELPDTAVGFASAVELASPVLPVLVDDDCAHDVPESPDLASGFWSMSTSPPSPPFAESWAMESPPTAPPPVTRLLRPLTRRRLEALPARDERAVARSPPSPPLPPTAVPATALAAAPVSPDTA